MCILHIFLHSVWEWMVKNCALILMFYLLWMERFAEWVAESFQIWPPPGEESKKLVWLRTQTFATCSSSFFLHMKCDFWPLVPKSRPVAYIWGIHCISKTVNTDHRNKILRQHSSTNILQNAKHERPWSSSFLCRLKKMQDTEDSRSYWQL